MKLGDFTGIRGIPNQDISRWETMGAIADRTKERLGASDLAVVGFRRLMVDAAREMQKDGPALGCTEPHIPRVNISSYRARPAQERRLADFRWDRGAGIAGACARTGRLISRSIGQFAVVARKQMIEDHESND